MNRINKINFIGNWNAIASKILKLYAWNMEILNDSYDPKQKTSVQRAHRFFKVNITYIYAWCTGAKIATPNQNRRRTKRYYKYIIVFLSQSYSSLLYICNMQRVFIIRCFFFFCFSRQSRFYFAIYLKSLHICNCDRIKNGLIGVLTFNIHSDLWCCSARKLEWNELEMIDRIIWMRNTRKTRKNMCHFTFNAHFISFHEFYRLTFDTQVLLVTRVKIISSYSI